MKELTPSIVPFGIGPSTRLVGLLGYPVAHSLSPAMHNACFRSLGWDVRYLAFAVPPERLGQAIAGIRGLDLIGVNVTIPHKEAVLPYLDQVEPQARGAGSVNTIRNQEAQLLGFNTDGPAFLALLREEGRLDPAGKRAVILGTGGTARTVASYLKRAGIAHLTIAGRNWEKSVRLAQETGAEAGVHLPGSGPSGETKAAEPAPPVPGTAPASERREATPHIPGLPEAIRDASDPTAAYLWGKSPYRRASGESDFSLGPATAHPPALEQITFADCLDQADVLINCTSAGLYPRVEGCPLTSLDPLPRGALVVDVIYNPPHTRLMTLASRRGNQVLGGLGLLIRQASLAWEIWFGQVAPLEIMRRAAEGILSQNVE
ncbi:MAG: shikimate dehydrogenase [Firmicutes bacterium]|nr:shikimate dehydrogenase [Bacillota bacterium]MCL5038958.1 shikimate dehydrogenase [Bacillota bacterium]